MRPSSPKSMLTVVLVATLAASAAVAHAQPSAGASGDASAQAAATQPSGPARTGKERLGEKWSDEQRVDNCKVPPDKRGPKPRPDTCAEVVTH